MLFGYWLAVLDASQTDDVLSLRIEELLSNLLTVLELSVNNTLIGQNLDCGSMLKTIDEIQDSFGPISCLVLAKSGNLSFVESSATPGLVLSVENSLALLTAVSECSFINNTVGLDNFSLSVSDTMNGFSLEVVSIDTDFLGNFGKHLLQVRVSRVEG